MGIAPIPVGSDAAADELSDGHPAPNLVYYGPVGTGEPGLRARNPSFSVFLVATRLGVWGFQTDIPGRGPGLSERAGLTKLSMASSQAPL
jgi:hypothetical protein